MLRIGGHFETPKLIFGGPCESTLIEIFIINHPMKQLQRFLSATTEDKYRNEIMQKKQVFLAVYNVRTLLKDWSTLRSFFSGNLKEH